MGEVAARGICRGCFQFFTIRADGLVRFHRNEGRTCKGAGRKPLVPQGRTHEGVDFAQVLNIIAANPEPAEALRAFVEQEREDAAHEARERVLAELADWFRVHYCDLLKPTG